MRNAYFFTVFVFVFPFFFSCGFGESEVAKSLVGNWLIVYPDHRLTTLHQRQVYAKYQDSLVALYGLKLLTLGADGTFREMDSLGKAPGKWMFTQDSILKFREAGKGFNPFNAAFTRFENNELLLTQFLPLEDEKIKLVWHLKKIEDDEQAGSLFSEEANAWRRKPRASQPTHELEKRLAAMLNYYAAYFDLVSKEAIYFSPLRVPLPLRYYQHGIGIQSKISPAFQHLFFNNAEASEAYELLEQGIGALQHDFPRSENFVTEYGLFLKKLAAWLEKERQ